MKLTYTIIALFFCVGCAADTKSSDGKVMKLETLIENNVSVGMPEEKLKVFFEEHNFNSTYQDIETVVLPAEKVPEGISTSPLKGKYIGIYQEPVSEGFASTSFFRLHALISEQGKIAHFRTEVVHVGS